MHIARARSVVLIGLGLMIGTRAQADDVPAAPPASEPSPRPQEQPAGADPLDLALRALVAGNLPLAEAAFERAARLATDPAAQALALDLAARVRSLAAARAVQLRDQPSPHDETAPPVAAEPAAPPAPARDLEVPGQGPPPPAAAPPRPVSPADPNAGATLVAITTLLGLGLYGPAVPGMLGLYDGGESSTRAAIGLYALTAAASFAVPFVANRKVAMTWGHTNMAYWGGTRGMELGFLVGALFMGDDDGSRGRWARLGLGSAAGALGGYLWADGSQLNAGQARLIGLGGDLGLLWGFGLGHLIGVDQHYREEFARDRDAEARGMAGVALVGTVSGLAGGYLLGQRLRSWSWGNGEITRAAGAVGAAVGLTAAALPGDQLGDHSELAVGLTMLGSAGGLMLGAAFVNGASFTFGEAVVADILLGLGALTGAGLTYVLLGDDAEPRSYLVGTTVGAAIGLGIAGVAFLPAARARRQSDITTGGVPRWQLFPHIGTHGERGLMLGGVF